MSGIKELPVTLPPSVAISQHMQDLMGDKAICKRISVAYPDLERVLFQIQLDIVGETNRDSVGATVLALRHIQDILSLFNKKGEALNLLENR
jgi:hypothetical protein